MSEIRETRIGRWDRKERTHCKLGHAYTEANISWKHNKKGYLCRECKECARIRVQRKREKPDFLAREAAAMRRYRVKLGDTYLVRVREERRKKKEWLDAFKVKCSRCDESHVACLEFHHRDPSQKDFLLSVGVAKYSLAKLQVEVEKCEVICSNCHRKHHWDQRHSGGD